MEPFSVEFYELPDGTFPAKGLQPTGRDAL